MKNNTHKTKIAKRTKISIKTVTRSWYCITKREYQYVSEKTRRRWLLIKHSGFMTIKVNGVIVIFKTK